jgi:hypothetical protein
MPRRAITHVLPAFLVAAVLAGCGIADPYTSKPATTSTTASPATTNGDPAPERGGTVPNGARTAQARVAAGAGLPTAQSALERYARLYVNWTAGTVASVQRQLATLSTGQARAQALQAAASYTRDQALARSGVANTGHLVAIGPSLANRGQWVLVTSEQTTGIGDYSELPATLHVTYAQVTRSRSGWVVSEWAPQN